MRSKGRSRPMSATLTPKRKSARDRPASSKEREGGLGERKREIDRSTRDRKPARNSVLTHTPEGSAGLSCLACSDRSVRRHRRPLLDAVVALERSSGIAAAAAHAVAVPPDTPYRHPSLCCSCHPSASRGRAIDATSPVCRERARMRKKWRVGCVARTAVTTSTTLLPPPRQPPLLPGQNRLTCPCQAQNAKNSPEKGRARARRAAPAVARPYRHLGPSEQPSRRPPTAPVVGLDRFCIAVQ